VLAKTIKPNQKIYYNFPPPLRHKTNKSFKDWDLSLDKGTKPVK